MRAMLTATGIIEVNKDIGNDFYAALHEVLESSGRDKGHIHAPIFLNKSRLFRIRKEYNDVKIEPCLIRENQYDAFVQELAKVLT